jgi:nitrite reductase (NADH) large subunit
MYAPHKVKLAVSGCPRNCAESGIKTEVAQFLCKVKTPEEVLEVSGAFLQLYRLEGWYLERTVHYIARVGLDHVKKRILDDAEGRKALWDQLEFALAGEPDPWFEFEKAKVDLRQFEPVASVNA